MNGAEHFAEAARLAALAATPAETPEQSIQKADTDHLMLAAAQVHATLAHAAAFVEAHNATAYALGGIGRTVDYIRGYGT